MRDESKPKDRDVACISFNFATDRVYVQYQYGEGQITQSSRLFKMVTVTSSEEFDPESVIEDIVYPYKDNLKPYEKYLMSQEMKKAESKARREVSILEDNIIQILQTRNQEQSEFKLKIDLLDWDRNYKMRQILRNNVIHCVFILFIITDYNIVMF